MKNWSFAIYALAAVLAAAPAAKADSTFDYFSFSGPGGVFGTFSLQASYQGSGDWLVDSGTGLFNDGNGNSGAISLIQNTNYPGTTDAGAGCPFSADCFAYDDQLNPTGGIGNYLDGDGLAFNFVNELQLNLYSTGGTSLGSDGWFEDNGDAGAGTFITPEPDSLPLMATGLFGLAILLVGRFRKMTQG